MQDFPVSETYAQWVDALRSGEAGFAQRLARWRLEYVTVALAVQHDDPFEGVRQADTGWDFAC